MNPKSYKKLAFLLPIAIFILFFESCQPDETDDFVYNPTPHQLEIPEGFPAPLLHDDNPLTKEGVELGRRLFYEPMLSKGNKISCSSCHNLSNAFTDEGKAFSEGVNGNLGNRNSMALFNLFYHRNFFWDGRAQLLRHQALAPIEDPAEMDETLANVIEKINQNEDYKQRFRAAFNTQNINSEHISMALEQFMFSIVSLDSKFDQAYSELQKNGLPITRISLANYLTPEEITGFELLTQEFTPPRPGNPPGGAGDCLHCHNAPLFRIHDFSNNGLDATFTDPGRANITGDFQNDAGKFKVPSLRNIAVSAPYMHDGRFETLEEVLDHYSTGVTKSNTIDPNMKAQDFGGLQLLPQEKEAIIAFLKTLTDSTYLNNPAYKNPF